MDEIAGSAGCISAGVLFGNASLAPLPRRRLLLSATAALAAPAQAQRSGVPAPSTAADDLRWPAAPPLLAAQQRRALAGLPARLAQLTDVQSVVVLHRGHLAHEFYRAGLVADSLQDVQSVTKSVLSLLFGQAQAAGQLRGPQELVALRLPAMLRQGGDARLAQLRFQHLLTMTAGWPADETAQRDRDDDLAQLVRRPLLAAPGARFAYDNGAANLLALALANALGQPLDEWARQQLFAPLGIGRFSWRRGAQGHALGALGLGLSTRAMARLGELVLAEGRWQGRPLVPAAHVRAATQRQNAGGPPLGNPYGYLWWVAPGPAGAPVRRTALASGYGGQWIYVQPQLDLVVAITSRRTPESAARGQGMQLIQQAIVPALRREAGAAS